MSSIQLLSIMHEVIKNVIPISKKLTFLFYRYIVMPVS